MAPSTAVVDHRSGDRRDGGVRPVAEHHERAIRLRPETVVHELGLTAPDHVRVRAPVCHVHPTGLAAVRVEHDAGHVAALVVEGDVEPRGFHRAGGLAVDLLVELVLAEGGGEGASDVEQDAIAIRVARALLGRRRGAHGRWNMRGRSERHNDYLGRMGAARARVIR
jgi:hypothetical protein